MNKNLNLNENTMNQIKNMVDNGNIADAISQISPEMIQNLSQMLGNKENEKPNNPNPINSNINYNNSSSNNNGFDFSNLDMNMVMKISSAMNKMNNKNDPRANLLQSLTPYLRDSKKNKVDQYVNMLNISKIADIMNKPNNNNQKD